MIGCEHSGEEAWSAAVGNYDDVSSGDLVVPPLSFAVEDDPDDADAKGDSRYESPDHLAGYGYRDSRFVAFLVNDGYAGDPFPNSATEDTGRDDEIGEEYEDINYGGLDVQYTEYAFVAAENWPHNECHHEQNPNVDCEGVDTSKRPCEFKAKGFDGARLS